jgi:hypothetical protein
VHDVPADTGLIYDAVRGLGEYRPLFAGYPRYTGGERTVPLTLSIARNAEQAHAGSNTAVVLLSDQRFAVPGWQRVSIDPYFSLYLPETPRTGLAGMADASEEFADALGNDRGAAFRLTSAAIRLRMGEDERALALLSAVLDDPELRPRALDAIRGSALERLLEKAS